MNKNFTSPKPGKTRNSILTATVFAVPGMLIAYFCLPLPWFMLMIPVFAAVMISLFKKDRIDSYQSVPAVVSENKSTVRF